MYFCSFARLQLRASAPSHYFSFALLHRSISAPLHCSIFALLHLCTAALLHFCPYALLQHSRLLPLRTSAPEGARLDPCAAPRTRSGRRSARQVGSAGELFAAGTNAVGQCGRAEPARLGAPLRVRPAGNWPGWKTWSKSRAAVKLHSSYTCNDELRFSITAYNAGSEVGGVGWAVGAAAGLQHSLVVGLHGEVRGTLFPESLESFYRSAFRLRVASCLAERREAGAQTIEVVSLVGVKSS